MSVYLSANLQLQLANCCLLIAIPVEESQSVQQMKCLIEANETLNNKLDKLYTIVVHLSEDIKIVKKMLTKQNAEKTTNDDIMYDLSHITLPIKTMDEFNDVEKRVQEADFRKCLINKLSTYGGNTISNIVHFMMNGLLERNLAVKFSLQGKTKEKFKDTHLFSCILGKLPLHSIQVAIYL